MNKPIFKSLYTAQQIKKILFSRGVKDYKLPKKGEKLYISGVRGITSPEGLTTITKYHKKSTYGQVLYLYIIY